MSDVDDAGRSRRAARWRITAVTVWLGLVAVLLTAGAVAAADYTSRPADERTDAIGGLVPISEPGEYSIYLETSGGYGPPNAAAAVSGPDGRPLPFVLADGDERYRSGDRYGIRTTTFIAPVAGIYRVQPFVDGPPGSDLVVSSATVGQATAAVAAGGAAVILLASGGVVLLVRRSRPDGGRPITPRARCFSDE